MIKVLAEGKYRLLETKDQTKILDLDNKTFAWINAAEIGEILVKAYSQVETDCILSVGKYKMYEVKDEPGIADLIHLELEIGENQWQGYLLLTGLPEDNDKRKRIIPTKELITK